VQERIYYALAGNIAINNCLNASACFTALGSENKDIRIPVPNYLLPSSFGSLELKKNERTEFIGQEIDYSDAASTIVSQRTLDSFNFERVDLVKIDVEGMELDVLEGAEQTIRRCKPQMAIEIIKSDKEKIEQLLASHGYKIFPMGTMNILAVHGSDPAINNLSYNNAVLHLDF
jgi:FkbM family methyltransferase